jgi:hypothetical protein
MAETHDAGHRPAADTLTLPEDVAPDTRSRWLDLFQRSGATQDQVNRLLEWHHLLLRDPQQAEDAAQADARQAVLDSRSERHARELSRALSVKRLSGQKLSAAEQADLTASYRQLAALQPPGAPRYDQSRGW